MSFLHKLVDERFLDHRRRSSSAAGIVGGIVAIGLWTYRFYFQHHVDWDLFAVALVIVGVKLSLMAWYTLRD